MAMRTPSARHWRAALMRFSPSRSILGCYAAKSTRGSNGPHKERSPPPFMSVIGPKGTLATDWNWQFVGLLICKNNPRQKHWRIKLGYGDLEKCLRGGKKPLLPANE